MESSNNNAVVPVKPLNEEEALQLRQSLKRCSADTIEAALDFRRTGDATLLPRVIFGIIQRFLEPESRDRMNSGDLSLRLMDDLGVDSLTLMEMIVLVEETLHVSIDNEEMRDLRTLEDIQLFVVNKVKGLPVQKAKQFFAVQDLVELLPQNPPFLFLNEATLSPGSATGLYQITGDEYFLEGHFKGNRPVFPASLMLEALGQLAVLVLLAGKEPELEEGVDPESVFFASCNTVRCQRVCRPGDLLTLSVKPRRFRHPLAVFEGSIRCGDEKVAWVEELVLSFDRPKAEKA